MGQIVVKNAVKREPGYLYYIDKIGNLCSAKMKRRVTGKKNVKKPEKKKGKK